MVFGVTAGKAFEALYSGGKCPGCGDSILQGELVIYVVGELTHEECSESGGSWTNEDRMPWE